MNHVAADIAGAACDQDRHTLKLRPNPADVVHPKLQTTG